MGVLMIALMYVMNQQRNSQLTEQPPTEQTERISDEDTDTSRKQTGDERPGDQPAFTDPAAVPAGDSAKAVYEAENARKYGVFNSYLAGEEDTFVVENDVLRITFSNHGGRPSRVELKNYKTWDQQPLIVHGEDKGEFDVAFSAFTGDGQTRGFHSGDLYFKTVRSEGENGAQIIAFQLDLGAGSVYEHEYIVPASGYLVDFNLNTTQFDPIINSRDEFFDIELKQRFESLENNVPSERMYSSLSYADADYGVDRLGLRKGGEKDADYSLKWVSFKQKFFSTTLMTEKTFSEAQKLEVEIPDHKEYVKDVEAKLSIEYEPGESFQFPMHFYFGPNKYKMLKSMDIKLEKTMQLGASVIRWVNLGIIIPMFHFLNKFISNYGVIILLLTIFIKLIVTPFTYKSYLSMIKMRVLQPELTELREKYGKDQQKMGAAQMDLYRKAGVNPLGGCLPMLFQFPILIAMYRFFPASIELRQESFLWAHDLSTYDSIYSWSAQIPFISDIYGNHISLFTILMAITSFFYTRLNSMNTPTADPNNPMAAQMKIFQYVMPFMLLFIFNKFSAALSYYYFLFNLFSVGQQYLMKRFLIDEDKIHAEIQANKKKVRKKSKWQMRMEEMMKQQQEAKKKKKR